MTRTILSLSVAALAGATLAWAADPIAYVTEIKKGRGQVQVKAAGADDWATPRPLLALRAGDQLRATGDARLVVLYHAGATTQTVTSANSPFTVGPPAGTVPPDQMGVMVSGVTQFLLGKQGPQTFRRAAARSPEATEGQWPVILAPRETRLFPGPVTFEWDGTDQVRYRVRLSGPQGPLWEQADLPRRPLAYPAAAPALAPGVLYTWELQAPGQPPQRARFELLADPEAARIREQLGLLERARGRGYSAGTVRVMRAAVLYQEGLYQEVRRELEKTATSDDPTVPTLLGHVYERVGLSGRAALAFERARALTEAPPR
jgi:hypothetical protein